MQPALYSCSPCAGSAFEHLLDVGKGARIVGLSQPEDRFLANGEVGIGVGDVDELGHTFFAGNSLRTRPSS